MIDLFGPEIDDRLLLMRILSCESLSGSVGKALLRFDCVTSMILDRTQAKGPSLGTAS